jgi:hypothetical protein
MRKVLMISVLATMALAGCGGKKKIGIAACDTYLEKVRACADKIGGDQGTGLKKQTDMLEDDWMKQKDNKDTAAGMEGVCKTALDQASQAFSQCDWK